MPDSAVYVCMFELIGVRADVVFVHQPISTIYLASSSQLV